MSSMRTQPRILEFFVHQAREQRLVSFRDVALELGITEQAAVSTLERLWRHRLITPPPPRPPGFKWRPKPGERVGYLLFRLTPRGRERLEWWATRAHREEGNPWPF
jgi:hypothetical protein